MYTNMYINTQFVTQIDSRNTTHFGTISITLCVIVLFVMIHDIFRLGNVGWLLLSYVILFALHGDLHGSVFTTSDISWSSAHGSLFTALEQELSSVGSDTCWLRRLSTGCTYYFVGCRLAVHIIRIRLWNSLVNCSSIWCHGATRDPWEQEDPSGM